MSDEPVFTRRGADFVPLEHTRGPWDPRHQHGGAVAALVARAAERTAGDEFCVSRLTVEIMRPVPSSRSPSTLAVPRPGRRVLGITISLSAGDLEVEVVRAHAVAIRRADLPTGEGHGVAPRARPGAGVVLPFGFAEDDTPAFHRSGMEVRFLDGGADRPGPARAWFRLQRPVVDGEQPSGVQRPPQPTSATASRGCCPSEQWIFLNPDLTLHLARPPVGEWIGLDAFTLPNDQGMAMAESRGVRRARPPWAGAVQSLLLQRRRPVTGGPPSGHGEAAPPGRRRRRAGHTGRPQRRGAARGHRRRRTRPRPHRGHRRPAHLGRGHRPHPPSLAAVLAAEGIGLRADADPRPPSRGRRPTTTWRCTSTTATSTSRA